MTGRSIAVGDMAPEVRLPDTGGVTRTLTASLRHGPVVLAFYRGHWWPFCVRQLADLSAAHPAFAAAEITVWGVSTDPPSTSALLKEAQFLPFELLSDLDREVTQAYGVLNRRERGGIPIPAVFAVAPDGRVIFAAVDRMARQTHPRSVLDAIGMARAGAPSPRGRQRWLLPRLRDLLGILRRGGRARG